MVQKVVDISRWDRISPIRVIGKASGTVCLTSDCKAGRARGLDVKIFVTIKAGGKLVYSDEKKASTSFIGGCGRVFCVTTNLNLDKTLSGNDLIPIINENSLIIDFTGSFFGIPDNNPRSGSVTPTLTDFDIFFDEMPDVAITKPEIIFENAQFEERITEVFTERKLVYQFLIDGTLINIPTNLKLAITIFDETKSITKMRDIPVDVGESFNWLDEIKDPQFFNLIDPKVIFKFKSHGDQVFFSEFSPAIVEGVDQPQGLTTNQKIGIGVFLASAAGLAAFVGLRKN